MREINIIKRGGTDMGPREFTNKMIRDDSDD